MTDTKKRDELVFKEFELDVKTLPQNATIVNLGRSTNDGKPQTSHVTFEFESKDEKAALKFAKNKYYVGSEKDDGDKYIWRVSFIRNY